MSVSIFFSVYQYHTLCLLLLLLRGVSVCVRFLKGAALSFSLEEFYRVLMVDRSQLQLETEIPCLGGVMINPRTGKRGISIRTAFLPEAVVVGKRRLLDHGPPVLPNNRIVSPHCGQQLFLRVIVFFAV